MHPLIWLVIIATVIYLSSCAVHPYMKCGRCNRSKEHHSTSFKGAFGKCGGCNGVGHTVRLGAKILGRR